jgi:hypothetical protein
MSSSTDRLWEDAEDARWQSDGIKAKELGIPLELGLNIGGLLHYIQNNSGEFSYKFYKETKNYFDQLSKYKI